MRRILFMIGGLILTLSLSAQDETSIVSNVESRIRQEDSPHADTLQQKDGSPNAGTPVHQADTSNQEYTDHREATITADELQDTPDTLAAAAFPDTVTSTAPEPILLPPDEASHYIDSLLQSAQLWRPAGDSMRYSLERLINHYNEPVDSVISRLEAFKYDSLGFEWTDIIMNDTLPLRWLNDSSFVVDTIHLAREPLRIQQTIVRNSIDPGVFAFADSLPLFRQMIDSMMMITDTVTTVSIDTAYLAANGVQLHQFTNRTITPPLVQPGSRLRTRFLADSSAIVLSDAWQARVGSVDSPFYIVPGEQLTDSLQAAIRSILEYTDQRDSVRVFINDMHGRKMPFWLTTGESELYRFWIKNYKDDSITVWMGNPEKDEITLFLEEEVNIDRLKIEPAAEIPVARLKPKKTLVNVEPLEVIPIYWEYDFSSAFAFNQTYLSHWAKGGENSVATMLDIKGQAKYTDKEAKIEWTNDARLKYGSIITEEYGLRTNTDQLEFNSQFNKVIKNKVDFSSVFYMKNQLAKGYNYPNDSVPVSKFLNPGTFTLGVGLEYKPFKKTVINYSPLSYKNTFVLDTAGIDQTAHGIAADKKVRQEMGGQLVVKNKLTILDGLEMNNSIRLFSNYFDNPLNVDVDWEMNLEKRINWYFTINLNLHVIYDDDIKFPVMDENDDPVKLPDGSIKKVPKMQFKEFVGLTFSFKF